MKILFLIFSLIFLNSCEDKEQVTLYDKSILKNKIKCLSFTPDKKTKLDVSLLSLYKFTKDCPYRLNLSYKSKIVCNSSYNAYEKSTSNFPNAYLNLEVKKGFNLIYNYYIDLNHPPTNSDLKRAFNRLKDDIL